MPAASPDTFTVAELLVVLPICESALGVKVAEAALYTHEVLPGHTHTSGVPPGASEPEYPEPEAGATVTVKNASVPLGA